MNDCFMQELVDAHFTGRIGVDDEARLRTHLPTCEPCHRRYRRRLLLAKLDPVALPAEERLGRGLGVQPFGERSASRWRTLGVVAGSLAMAAAVLLAVRGLPGRGDGFVARGPGHATAPDTPEPLARIEVFHAPKEGTFALATGSLRANEELAFSYENRTKSDRMMIFGIDEHGHVYWYYPAWTVASADPQAITIATDGARHELKEAIVHRLDGKILEVHALFLSRDATVKEVERSLEGRRAPLERAPLLPGTTEHVVRFEVTP